jgi:acylphosphatase
MKHLNIMVTGKVQGVFFRKYTEQKALELGITGLVRNLDDGSVYIEAEGPEDQLADFVEWCYEGSPSSRVADVLVEESTPVKFTSFQILR